MNNFGKFEKITIPWIALSTLRTTCPKLKLHCALMRPALLFYLPSVTPHARAMDDLRFRNIFYLGITKDISGKKLSKLEKLQILVAKCCKIRKI